MHISKKQMDTLMARHDLPSELKAQEIDILVLKRRSSPESLISVGDNKEPHDMALEFRITTWNS